MGRNQCFLLQKFKVRKANSISNFVISIIFVSIWKFEPNNSISVLQLVFYFEILKWAL